ncbi:MAG: hypothetical protein IKP11_04735 [Paludibacteraceae bacterium]|nr:hypothetical protein [Paludibacteraceae bacterium]
MQGYIKLYRKVKDWQHYQDPTVKHVFFDLLLDASHRPTWCHGLRLQAGDVATSLRLLEKSTQLSRHTIIAVLNKLEASGEIRRKRCKNCTIITICNYALYQDNNAESGATTAPLESNSSAEITPHDNEGGAEGGATTAPHNKNTRIIYNNIESENVRVRAQEKVDELRLQVLDSWSVEQACYTNHITEEQYKLLAEEIFSDWLFAVDENKPVQPQLDEINKKHFLAVLRIKAQILVKFQRNGTENIQSNRDIQRRGVDTKAVKSEDYDTAF